MRALLKRLLPWRRKKKVPDRTIVYTHPTHPQSLKITKNSYAGQRCFIAGTAPSISALDLSLLKNDVIFTVNRGYLLLQQGLPHIDFYAVSDMNAFKSYGDEINFQDFKQVFLMGPIDNSNLGRNLHNVSTLSLYEQGASHYYMHNNFFQFDITRPLARGYTVVLNQLQIAVWLGFEKIYFIGVDNDFNHQKNMHFYKDTTQEKKHMQKYSPPEQLIAKAFLCARNILQGHGISIYNATRGGKLEAIERVSYESLF